MSMSSTIVGKLFKLTLTGSMASSWDMIKEKDIVKKLSLFLEMLLTDETEIKLQKYIHKIHQMKHESMATYLEKYHFLIQHCSTEDYKKMYTTYLLQNINNSWKQKNQFALHQERMMHRDAGTWQEFRVKVMSYFAQNPDEVPSRGNAGRANSEESNVDNENRGGRGRGNGGRGRGRGNGGRGRGRGRGRNADGERICFSCQETGHMSRDCPTNNSGNNNNEDIISTALQSWENDYEEEEGNTQNQNIPEVDKLIDNGMLLELKDAEIYAKDGRLIKTKTWVDTMTTRTMISARLVKQLQLKVESTTTAMMTIGGATPCIGRVAKIIIMTSYDGKQHKLRFDNIMMVEEIPGKDYELILPFAAMWSQAKGGLRANNATKDMEWSNSDHETIAKATWTKPPVKTVENVRELEWRIKQQEMRNLKVRMPIADAQDEAELDELCALATTEGNTAQAFNVTSNLLAKFEEFKKVAYERAPEFVEKEKKSEAKLEELYETLKEWMLNDNADPELVRQIKELLQKHFERESGAEGIPFKSKLADVEKWDDCIDITKKPIHETRRGYGQFQSEKWKAEKWSNETREKRGMLSGLIHWKELPETVSIVNMHAVKKKPDLEWGKSNIRHTVNGKPLRIHNMYDEDKLPKMERKLDPLSTLMNAANDDGKPIKFAFKADIMAAYDISGRCEIEDSNLAIWSEKPTFVRMVLAPINGIGHAGIHFDRAVVKTFPDHITKCGYVDDNARGRNDVNDLLKDFIELLQLAWDNDITLSIAKLFLGNSISSFGYIVDKEGMRVETSCIDEMLKITAPMSKVELKQKGGLPGYFAKFNPEFEMVMKPIRKIFASKTDGQRLNEQEKVQVKQLWQIVLETIRKRVTINQFSPNLDTFIGVDWAIEGRSAYFFQVTEEGLINVIAHFRREHKTKVERAAPPFIGEFGIMAEAVTNWRRFLMLCRRMIVMMGDHKPIITGSVADFINIINGKEKKYSREAIFFVNVLGEFNLAYWHCLGVNNFPPDFWTRMTHLKYNYKLLKKSLENVKPGDVIYQAPETVITEEESEDAYKLRTQEGNVNGGHQDLVMVNVEKNSAKEAESLKREMQRKASVEAKQRELDKLIEAATVNPPDLFYNITRRYLKLKLNNQERMSMTIDIGLMDESSLTEMESITLQEIVAGTIDAKMSSNGLTLDGIEYTQLKHRYESLKNAHSILSVGHFGKETMLQGLQQQTWPDKTKDVINFLALCPRCDREKKNYLQPASTALPPSKPFFKVTMDVKPLQRGQGYLFEIKDTGSGLIALTQGKQKNVALWKLGATKWIATYGRFEEAVYDNDAVIKSAEWKEFQQKWKFTARTTSPYNKSNGAIEIENRYINDILAKEGGDHSSISVQFNKINLVPSSNLVLCRADQDAKYSRHCRVV